MRNVEKIWFADDQAAMQMTQPSCHPQKRLKAFRIVRPAEKNRIALQAGHAVGLDDRKNSSFDVPDDIDLAECKDSFPAQTGLDYLLAGIGIKVDGKDIAFDHFADGHDPTIFTEPGTIPGQLRPFFDIADKD